MRHALLYLLAAIFLVLIVSVAWWTREFVSRVEVELYTVPVGQTVESMAGELGVTPEELAVANDKTVATFKPQPGQEIRVPPREPTAVDIWKVHIVGLLAEALGVLMSFWLAIVAGLLPTGLRRQILGIALVLGIASYAAVQGIAPGEPQLTPQFVFMAIKDGFAWSAAFPLFARAFGFTRDAAASA